MARSCKQTLRTALPLRERVEIEFRISFDVRLDGKPSFEREYVAVRIWRKCDLSDSPVSTEKYLIYRARDIVGSLTFGSANDGAMGIRPKTNPAPRR